MCSVQESNEEMKHCLQILFLDVKYDNTLKKGSSCVPHCLLLRVYAVVEGKKCSNCYCQPMPMVYDEQI